MRSLSDRGLAEEAVQETFVRAWRAGERFDPELGSLRTWLFAILRNVVIDMSAPAPRAGRSASRRPRASMSLLRERWWHGRSRRLCGELARPTGR